MTEYAFILTGQYPHGAGFATFTFEGTFNVTPGATRMAALKEVMDAAKKYHAIGAGVQPNVLFFSLEPNQIGGA